MDNTERIPVIIFGTAGAATDIYYWIKAVNNSDSKEKFSVHGFVDNEAKIGKVIYDGIKVIGSDSDVSEIIKGYSKMGLVVPFGNPVTRERIVKKFSQYPNVYFPNIIHPTVIYDRNAGVIGMGNHIGPGTVIESVFKIGNFNYISGGVELGHDIVVGDFNSINPSVATAGNVTVTQFCTLGINSTLIQNLTVRPNTVLGAGAVLIRDSEGDETLVGVPARRVE